MNELQDLIGQKFGQLTVLRKGNDYYEPSGYRRRRWWCLCDCGKETLVWEKCLKNGHTKSCGCLVRKRLTDRNIKHGEAKTRLYSVWKDMRQRCDNPNHPAFMHYGGRGIKICKQWDDFTTFKEWAIESGYNDEAKHGECTIDRIDVNKGYAPDNCRWIDMAQQTLNRRNTKLYTYNGETLSLPELAKKYGVKYSTLRKRLSMSGFDINIALSKVGDSNS